MKIAISHRKPLLCDDVLVVIGTHGRTGLAHIRLGSITEKVVRTTACAVLTVRLDAFRFDLP